MFFLSHWQTKHYFRRIEMSSFEKRSFIFRSREVTVPSFLCLGYFRLPATILRTPVLSINAENFTVWALYL